MTIEDEIHQFGACVFAWRIRQNDQQEFAASLVVFNEMCKDHRKEMSSRLRIGYQSTMSRFDILALLYLAGAVGRSTTELANRLLASMGNITRLLDRME